MNKTMSLGQLGWQPFFQQQLTLDEFESCICGRITDHHRSEYIVQTENKKVRLPITSSTPAMTVGDWVLLNAEHVLERLLERKSIVSRKAAGTKVEEQFIAANLDTLFIVASLNQDFNLSRIERYLAIAHEAQIEPVVVLTKRDKCNSVDEFITQVTTLEPYLAIVAVNSLDQDSVSPLLPWLKLGKTVSVVGSSGVGKSTLIGTLLGNNAILTGEIREADAKGRHTTTARSMYYLPSGGIILDTPGMREIQLTSCEDGVSQTFADVEAIIQACRFSNCQHTNEPGCAVNQAIADGQLTERRVQSYQKLQREQAHNAASLQQKRAKDKAFSKMCRQVITSAHHAKKGY